MTILHAPAKLNLTLSITGRDEAGYHQLVSLAGFTQFGDNLTLTKQQAGTPHQLSITGSFATKLEQEADNLIFKALSLYEEMTGHQASYHISLDKQIPLGGGLGGGSADAASLLRFLSQDDEPELQEALREASVTLGADVPACFDSCLHVMMAKGEEAHRLTSPERLPYVILTNPGCHADTALVFAKYKEIGQPFQESDPHQIAALAERGAWQALLAIGNDLTEAACALYPPIQEMLAACQQIGHEIGDEFIGSAMTGSGACGFALLATEEAATRYQSRLSELQIWHVVTKLS